jgi:hypothetical protein
MFTSEVMELSKQFKIWKTLTIEFLIFFKLICDREKWINLGNANRIKKD